MDPDTSEIETTREPEQTPQRRATRWNLEISAAKKNLEQFHQDGDKVIKEYLGEGGGKRRLNLFYADVQTKAATLSGQPKIRAKRRHADAMDDVARVSADMLERLLNTDVERDSDGFRRALNLAKSDWQKPALGQIRMRYVFEEQESEAPCPACMSQPAPGEDDPQFSGMEVLPQADPDCEACGGSGHQSVKTFEDVETDYVFWRDYLWSPCRFWEERRWEAYGAHMNRDELHDRFDACCGHELVRLIPLNSAENKSGDGNEASDPLKCALVWEIWDRDEREVIWMVEGFSQTLDVKPDPLGLPNFNPSPEPLAANLTTSKFIPKSSYFLAEDLYEQAHELTARIRALVSSIKVVGAYAKGNDALKAILDDACDNELVCVDSLQALLGQDGVANAAWFMPIAPMVEAVVQLVAQRNLIRSDIAEVLGLSDIMRGQQAQRVTATTDRIKARAFSMRTQTDQDEYARFASDAQRIRAHIISKHFGAATIIKRSNIEASMPGLKSQDPAERAQAEQLLAQAVQLLKDDISAYRIEVDSESLSMTDLDAVQQENLSILEGTAKYFQGTSVLMQAGGPPVQKFFLEMFRQAVAGFRGGERFESVIDRAIAELEEAAKAPKPPPPPDPKAIAAQAQAQAQVGKAKADMVKTGLDLKVAQVEHGQRMQEIQAETVHAQVEAQAAAVKGLAGGNSAVPGEL